MDFPKSNLKANTNNNANTIRIASTGIIVLNFEKTFVDYTVEATKAKIKELESKGTK